MKVLIVTETIAGMGHVRAAQAIEKGFKGFNPGCDIRIEYLLSVYNRSLEKIVSIIYYKLIYYAPNIWGYLHNCSKKKSYFSKKFIANMLALKLDKFINKEKPELIIATHACGLGALSILKERYKFNLAAVFTDYQTNDYWVNKNIDYYFVPHIDLKNELINKYNVNSQIVFDTGIPIDPVFNIHNEIKEEKNINIENGNYKLLIMGGGLGIGKIKDLIMLLNCNNTIPFSLTVITGANEILYKELIKIVPNLCMPIEIHKYCNNIYQIMKSNDLLISKPGGLTISEALTIPLPIIIYNPIPGQEEDNTEFLTRRKAAIKVENIEEIPDLIKYLYYNPDEYQKLKDNQIKIAKPNSTNEIIKLLQDLND